MESGVQAGLCCRVMCSSSESAAAKVCVGTCINSLDGTGSKVDSGQNSQAEIFRALPFAHGTPYSNKGICCHAGDSLRTQGIGTSRSKRLLQVPVRLWPLWD